MAITLVDGKGRGYEAGVNVNNRLLTAGSNSLRGHFVSIIHGRAFNTISVDPSADAGDLIFYFKNDDTSLQFFVDLLRCQAVNAALWKVWEVTGTAAGGNALTPTNLNLNSGVAADATARGDGALSGLTLGNLIATGRSVAGGFIDIPFDEILFFGNSKAIAVEYDTGTTGAAEVLMRGYFQGADDQV